jgi:hypothetical protein
MAACNRGAGIKRMSDTNRSRTVKEEVTDIFILCANWALSRVSQVVTKQSISSAPTLLVWRFVIVHRDYYHEPAPEDSPLLRAPAVRVVQFPIAIRRSQFC